MTIRIVPPADGQLWDLGSRITCKVTSESTGDEYTALEVILKTGQGPPVPGELDRYFEEVSAAMQNEKPEEIENIYRKYEIEFLRCEKN